MSIQFLLDENVDPLYRRELLEQDVTMVVWRVGDIGAPPRSTLDPDILTWCQDNSFLLVTNNRKSMPVHLRDHLAQGKHVPGIIVLNEDMSAGDTIEQLNLIWAAGLPDEFRDLIIYLPLR
jgi:hypothetical protein